MIYYGVYGSSGEFSQVGNTSASSLRLPDNFDYVTSDDEVTLAAHYAPSAILTHRPANLSAINKSQVTAENIETVTVSDIPNPSELCLSGGEINGCLHYEITDGEFIFDLADAGDYEAKVTSAFPSKDVIFNIACHEKETLLAELSLEFFPVDCGNILELKSKMSLIPVAVPPGMDYGPPSGPPSGP